MKGLVLAGGTGSRLRPLTLGISKQLIPIHNKPLIYYPLATLMNAGIRDILIITTPLDLNIFQRLLGDGSRFGVTLSYIEQANPDGLARAFTIGEKFLGGSSVALILGDNIFHGSKFIEQLHSLGENQGANVFGYEVSDPSGYGIAELDGSGNVLSIEEKPIHPKSRIAIPGLYFYDNSVIEIAKSITPSPRGEYEITSVNNIYLKNQNLKLTKLARGTVWLDAGTLETLEAASTYVKVVEEREGNMIGCLEEIAFENGWVTDVEIEHSINLLGDCDYARYLKSILD
jgi:glucose-1-phosphate thymidylyltransferase